MNFNKLTGTVVILMLSSAAVFAADAHHDHQAPAPATDSHAADAKSATANNVQSKDASAKDAASPPADEPGKAATAKKSRKPARAKPQHKAPTHVTQADAQGSKDAPATDAHAAHDASSAPANANEGHGSKRLRVKNRVSPAAVSSNAAEAHSTSSAPAAAAGHDAPAAAAALGRRRALEVAFTCPHVPYCRLQSRCGAVAPEAVRRRRQQQWAPSQDGARHFAL